MARYTEALFKAGIGKHVIQFENLITASQYETPYQIVNDETSAKDVVLDWGSGNGHFAYFLKTQIHCDITTYSFEDKAACIEQFDSIKHVNLDHSSPVKLPFADGSYDVVFSMGVLEHVHETGGDQLASLKEIERVLKSDGRFVCLHFPRKYSLNEFLSNLVRSITKKGEGYIHTRKFTASQIKTLCRDSGLQLERIGSYNFIPRNSAIRLPAALKHSPGLLYTVNALDWLLSRLFWFMNQNFYFVAVKKEPQ